MSHLQDLVDSLADSLGRPVGIDDRQLRSVAYSAHVDGVDPVRLASILQREAPRAVVQWLNELGITRIDTLLRLPANPEFGMTARVCIPLRFDERLLGFLWLIDSPTPLDDAQLGTAFDLVPDLAVALYRLISLEQSTREDERNLLRSALGLGPEDARSAADQLTSIGLLTSTKGMAVLAVTPHRGSEPPRDPIQARVTAAVEHDRRFAAPGRFLVLVEPRRVYSLLAVDTPADVRPHATRIAERVQDNLADREGWSATVGISGMHGDRTTLARARTEAELAGDLAMQVPGLGAVARWDELGAYRTIARAAHDKDPRALLPDSLRTLLAESEAATLVPTLLTYLEAAGDARAAAEQLFLHRSSLYHRLRRIERICQVDLSSGDARLELHLGLRLWRIAGEPLPAAKDPGRPAS